MCKISELIDSIGVLVECDASIKAIIVEIDRTEGGYIVEDLDDQTLVVKEDRLAALKMKLEEVGTFERKISKGK